MASRIARPPRAARSRYLIEYPFDLFRSDLYTLLSSGTSMVKSTSWRSGIRPSRAAPFTPHCVFTSGAALSGMRHEYAGFFCFSADSYQREFPWSARFARTTF
jgi:hypothetical protein